MHALFGPLLALTMWTLGSTGCCPGHASYASAGTSSGSEVGDVQRGEVSYYSNALKGHRTASGERYNPKELTAASRTLPFGTRVKVTRLDNGKSVTVRVNDRGPFGHRRRILDLSRAAAEQLDMVGSGLVDVEAVVVE